MQTFNLKNLSICSSDAVNPIKSYLFVIIERKKEKELEYFLALFIVLLRAFRQTYFIVSSKVWTYEENMRLIW